MSTQAPDKVAAAIAAAAEPAVPMRTIDIALAGARRESSCRRT